MMTSVALYAKPLIALSSQPSIVSSDGHVISGAVVSSIVITCVQLVLFKQASKAVYVRSITNGHSILVITSMYTKLSIPQLSKLLPPTLTRSASVMMTSVALYAKPLIALSSHPSIVSSDGHVISGAVVSSIVITCVQLVLFKQASNAVNVRSITNGHSILVITSV